MISRFERCIELGKLHQKIKADCTLVAVKSSSLMHMFVVKFLLKRFLNYKIMEGTNKYYKLMPLKLQY